MAVLALASLAGCMRAPPPVAFHAEGLPETLSAWHLFKLRGGELAPNDGVLPYELNTPLFTDYAHKLRTVWMPAGTAAGYRADETFEFPVGTILSKTFYYPRLAGEPADGARVQRSDDRTGTRPGGRLALAEVRLVETRLLVRREAGWVALPYVWNAAQTEARLMRGGSLVRLELVDATGASEPAAYAVPDQNQCAGCHASDLRSRVLHPIGPNARNLNRDLAYRGDDGGEIIRNQLAHWQQAGLLTGAPEPASAPRLADWRDSAGASLDARARAYLDSNCAHCHSPRGPGNTSGLWLGSDVVEPLRLGRCKLPIAAGQGTGDRRFGYVPGDPDASILSFRIESVDPGVMMPELGRSVVHREGAALIREWIAAQTGECGTGDEPSGTDVAENNNDQQGRGP
ncbi:hypothetical protein E1B00_10685 [Arenimonas terrae]|uniref:Cytochrome c domain-containing protein n=2 Tax=Arenimonas terrae TaxID=2546226 RepID=A0A5C4RSK0_9GAMM|nr:hypothetical protein E1B00_10685 [Arenimonas terrae]